MSKIVYVAVSRAEKGLVNRYYPNVLYNPVRQNFDRVAKNERYEQGANFADSGGFQIAKAKESPNKWCEVLVGAGIVNRKNSIIIDPIELCRQYGKLGIKFGFTLDHPFGDRESPTEFYENLEDSYSWARHMFKARSKLCPGTKFIIPLHFFEKDQLEYYYNRMSRLAPDGYAIPAYRRRSYDDAVSISYTLSFLHHKGVKIVHLLGCSNRTLIGIMASAIGGKLFKMISFDSASWNNSHYGKGYFYLDPFTLKQRKIVPGRTLPIYLPKQLNDLKSFDKDDEFSVSKQKLSLCNAFAIRRYAKRLAEKAHDIRSFLSYLPQAGFGKSEMKKTTAGIQILIHSITKGFDYVRKNVTLN